MTVIIKATFEIGKGKTRAAQKQLPIFAADQHYRDDPTSPVRLETDRVPYKPLADVGLIGRAHAPLRQPVTQLDVSVRVGSLYKIVRVFGDRKWWYWATMSSAQPFLTMDLTYGRAWRYGSFGGSVFLS